MRPDDMSRWTQAVHDYLIGATPSRFRHQRVAIHSHWQGRDNLLWRVRAQDGADAVVKMFTDAGQARCRRQFSGQEQFAAGGLAPEPLWYDRYPHGLPRQLLVYRWEDGDALRLTDRRHRIALADSVARLHCAGSDAALRFSPHPFNLLTFSQIWQAGEAQLRLWLSSLPAPQLNERLSGLWAAAHRTLDEALPRLGETPPTPIHGELSADNGLVQQDRVLLVDWEFFGLGDPAQEIARLFFFGGDDWPPDAQEEWWQWYQPGAIADNVACRVRLYMQLFNFQAVTFLLEGFRQGLPAQPGSSSADLDRNGQYFSFLVNALTVAISRSLSAWGMPPLAEADEALLEAEIYSGMNIHLDRLHAAGAVTS